jgi:hypothetical protein
MKKQSLRIFLMIGFLAIVAVLPAHAQSASEQTADVPFSFTVGSKTFPAGTYSVKRLNPQSDRTALAIKSADGRASKIVLTVPVQSAATQESAKLIFNRYGDQYFLSQVWTTADNTGLELPRSRAERALERSGIEDAPERLTVALNPRRR